MTATLDAFRTWMDAFMNDDVRQVVGSLALGAQPVAALAHARGQPIEVVQAHLSRLQALDLVVADLAVQPPVYRLNEAPIQQVLAALEPMEAKPLLAGQPAPEFCLASADGREIALADCLRRGPTIVWISRGICCSFCRRHRAQLTLGYPAFRAFGAEILEITPTPPAQAALYFAHYPLAFPYLCDPDGDAARQYGIARGRFVPLALGRAYLADVVGPKEVVREDLARLPLEPAPGETDNGGSEDGFFIVETSGRVCFGRVGPFIGVPTNAEIEQQLRAITA